MLRKAVSKVHSGLTELSFDQVEEAIRFLSSAQTGRAMDLPSGLIIEREYDAFFLFPATEGPGFRAVLSVPGVTVIPEVSLEAEARLLDGRAEAGDENYSWQAEFDYDKISLPLEIRTRRAGDRFCPSGMGGKSKKLQDYFVDQKVPRRERDIVPILASKEDVIWVIGMRTDERFLPKAETKRVLVVGVRKSG
jgi:tRNA(Ile)-lysidine synthase